MWKKIRFLSFALVFLSLVILIYNNRDIYIVPLAQAQMNKLTGNKLQIGSFAVSLPFKLSLYNINYDRKLIFDEVEINLNPVKILKGPLYAITEININKATVAINTEGAADKEKTAAIIEKIGKLAKKADLKIKTSEASVIINSNNIVLTDTDISFNKNIAFQTLAQYKKHAVKFDGKIELEKDSLKPSFTSEITGILKSKIFLTGKYEARTGFFDFSADAETLSLSKVDFGKYRLRAHNNPSGMSFFADGDSGSIAFTAPKSTFDIFSSSGTLTLKDSEDMFSSRFEYTAEMKDGMLDLSAFLKDIKMFGSNLGTLSVKANNNNKRLNLYCSHDIGSNLDVTVEENGDYKVNIYNEKPVGYFSGNYKYGTLSIDIKRLPLNRLSVMRAYDKNIRGFLSLYGDIDKENGFVSINLENVNSQRIRNLSGSGKLSKQNGIWDFDFITRDKKLSFQAVYKNKNDYTINTSYDNVDIGTILKVFNSKIPVSGFASGIIKYNSNFDSPTLVDMRIKNGTLYSNAFSNCEISGELSSKTIKISTFTITGPETKVTLKSLIDFDGNNSNSFLYCDVQNFKINSVNLNSKLYFEGKINGTKEISGQLIIPKFDLNEFDLSGFTADIILSTKKIEIKNADNKNGLSGGFMYDLKTGRYESEIAVSKADISKHYKNITGELSGEFKLKGEKTNPEIKTSYNLKQAFFAGIKFNSSGEYEYKNKLGKVNRFTVHSDKTAVFGSGTINAKKVNMNLKISNLTENIINNYLGFETPVAGIFNGTGSVFGSLSDLKCMLKLESGTVYFKKIKLHDFSSEMLFSNDEISIFKTSIKLTDSQINLNGTFNTKTNLYSFIFNFVNAHAGPFDIFGNLNLNGKMTATKDYQIYSGNISFDNLWINREKIDSLKFDYLIDDKKISLKTQKEMPLQISGAVNFSEYPKLRFENIFICHNNQSCYIDGNSATDSLNVAMTWKSLDGLFVSHLFDLPFDLDGNIDVAIKAAGSLSNPVISCVLNSKSGSIENIPYDSIDVDLAAKNNILSINTLKIYKINDYAATASGTFPFWLDPDMAKSGLNKKININYEITDNKLSLISNFAKDSISVKKGRMQMTGTLAGTRKKPTHRAKLELSASTVTTDLYVQKIKDVNISATFKDNLFSIQNFTASAGSGKLNVEGEIHFAGLNPSFYNLSVFTSKKGIPIVIKDLPIPTSGVLKMEKNQVFANYSKGTPKFNFKIYGPANDFKLTGWAELEDTRFCYPPPDNYDGGSSSDLSIFDNCYINIDLKSAVNTRYENSFANIFLKGKINLRGKTDSILANGVIESDSGKLFYMGTDLDLVNSKVEIINNEIFISGEAETEVYNAGDSMPDVVKIYIDRSTVDNLKTRFVSKNDPTLDSNKVLAKVTKTDQTQRQIIDTTTDFLVKQQAVRIFSANIATPLANTVLKKTGIIDNVRLGYVNTDNLQVASGDEPTMAEILYGMKYSVEKNINRNLQLGYSVTFDQLNREIDLKHALEMSVRLNRFLFLKGSYGLKSEDPQYKPENRIMLEQKLRFGGSSNK